ncbi:hypothetical protein QJS10_CPB17g02131 [Acorus calamus]|uniref:Uncharacterized protein n=1 Tax=Acorus calamus TaxID=4465 RepID=A0AAV9CUA1_ACOCL|nr:hypothetical protein QJS10_CPB17g02131 [Acorus calamus]
MGSSKNRHFFPLTSLQIGDLQSYLSDLTLFLAPDSNKIFILVDNRPWLVDHDSRPAHLWQFMVTKTDTSMALEAKLMKRWEFDSIEQAATFVHSWFSGTHNESHLLKGYLDDISVKGEVYYDAQEDFSAVNLSNSGVQMASDYDSFGTISLSDDCSDFGFSSDGAQYQSSLLHTPPPPSGLTREGR